MECPKCKKAAPEEAVFCPWCGKRLAKPERKYKKRANATGSIYKLPGNRKRPWQARKSGKSIGTFPTRAEAQKALERLTDTPVNDLFNKTFAQVYKLWKEEHCRGIDPKTAAGYALAFSHCPQLHDQKIRQLIRSDYQAALIALEQRGMSKSSVSKLRTLLNQVAQYAMDNDITVRNPAQELEVTAQQKSQRYVFTDEEIARIAASTTQAAQVALILIACGCRPNELFTVPLSNCAKDHFIWGSKTEKGKNRVIPIGPIGLEAYQAMRHTAITNGEEKLIGGYPGNKTPENFRRREWQELMAEIGVETTPYSCRHTFITKSIRSGVDLMTLESIVGHVDKETTKIYTHLRASDLVTAVQKNTVDYKLSTSQSAPKSKTG